MSRIFENPLKRLLREGKRTAGAWLQIASPYTAEIMSQAGFDWLMIDMEHGPGDIPTLVSQLQAMNGSGVVPLVRAPWNDAVIIKRVLDAGAYGVLVPSVNSGEEALAAVRACRYPPAGVRGVAGSPRAAGYGQSPMGYLSRANDEILVLCAVETGTALSNLEDILQVEGLDGIFIGPMDLASSLGHLGEPAHPEVRVAVEMIESKVLASGKFLATVSTSWEQAEALYRKGYLMVNLMADGVSLGKLAGERASLFHSVFPDR